jgi:hypothetical protein
MSQVMRSIVASVLLLAVAACASAPKGDAGDGNAEQGSVRPPQLIRTGPPPELRPPPQASVRTVIAHIDVEVMVDAMGNPDMATFKATGRGSELNQDTLRTWIGTQRFQPAQRNGQNVPGLFKMSYEARRR